MSKVGAEMGFHIVVDKELSIILDDALYAEIKGEFVEFRDTQFLLGAYKLESIIGFHETKR